MEAEIGHVAPRQWLHPRTLMCSRPVFSLLWRQPCRCKPRGKQRARWRPWMEPPIPRQQPRGKRRGRYGPASSLVVPLPSGCGYGDDDDDGVGVVCCLANGPFRRGRSCNPVNLRTKPCRPKFEAAWCGGGEIAVVAKEARVWSLKLGGSKFAGGLQMMAVCACGTGLFQLLPKATALSTSLASQVTAYGDKYQTLP